jgi:hypothetical protein
VQRDRHRMGACALARDAKGGVGGATGGQPRWLGGVPLMIPNLEAPHVKCEGGPIDLGPGQREYLRPTPPAGDVHEARVVGLGVAGGEVIASRVRSRRLTRPLR